MSVASDKLAALEAAFADLKSKYEAKVAADTATIADLQGKLNEAVMNAVTAEDLTKIDHLIQAMAGLVPA